MTLIADIPGIQRHHGVQPLDRDKLAMCPRDKAADAAQHALFGIQDLPPHEGMMGLAVLMAALCERMSLDPEELYHMGNRVLRDREFEPKANDSLQAIRDFAGLRYLGKEVTLG